MSAPESGRAPLDCRLVWTGAEKGGTTRYEAYSREARIEIDGKPPLPVSAAPPFLGDPALHNPEDLLVAALSACHFLSYAALCARSGSRSSPTKTAPRGRWTASTARRASPRWSSARA